MPGCDSAASSVIAYKFRAKVITPPKRTKINVNMSHNYNVIITLILLKNKLKRLLSSNANIGSNVLIFPQLFWCSLWWSGRDLNLAGNWIPLILTTYAKAFCRHGSKEQFGLERMSSLLRSSLKTTHVLGDIEPKWKFKKGSACSGVRSYTGKV